MEYLFEALYLLIGLIVGLFIVPFASKENRVLAVVMGMGFWPLFMIWGIPELVRRYLKVWRTYLHGPE